jgi:hypothetical protein
VTAPLTANRNLGPGRGLGTSRRVVKVIFDWLFNHRSPRVPQEKLDGSHHAFLTRACALISWNRM